MAKGHWSGTVAHSNMAHHGGKEAGAGELTFGSGPGKAAMKTRPDKNDLGVAMDSGKNSGKGPKGKPYKEE